MGINQPKVSALKRRKLDGFSVERIIHFLNALGQDIDIVNIVSLQFTMALPTAIQVVPFYKLKIWD